MDSEAPEVTKCASEILERIGILENPYFKQLKDGSMSLEDFQKSQEQFYFAVVFFSRPMAALAGRIDNPKDRLGILENVVEEHGNMNEDCFHSSTFRKFLLSVIGKETEFEGMIVCPQVRAFNAVITTACIFDEIEVGIGCMGIIELAFADISTIVGNAVVERGWIRREDLTHYKLHAEIDARHADDFFKIVEKKWQDPNKQYYIKQGLELGAYIFDRLYRDLLDYAHAFSKRGV
jgi:pyrroloquinoline-quinone synthase